MCHKDRHIGTYTEGQFEPVRSLEFVLGINTKLKHIEVCSSHGAVTGDIVNQRIIPGIAECLVVIEIGNTVKPVITVVLANKKVVNVSKLVGGTDRDGVFAFVNTQVVGKYQ